MHNQNETVVPMSVGDRITWEYLVTFEDRVVDIFVYSPYDGQFHPHRGHVIVARDYENRPWLAEVVCYYELSGFKVSFKPYEIRKDVTIVPLAEEIVYKLRWNR